MVGGVAAESADHDGEVEGQRCVRGYLAVRGPQPDQQRGKRRALAEPEYPVETRLPPEQGHDRLAGTLPAPEVVMPPAEVAGGQGRGIDVHELGDRLQILDQRPHLATQDAGAAVVPVQAQYPHGGCDQSPARSASATWILPASIAFRALTEVISIDMPKASPLTGHVSNK